MAKGISTIVAFVALAVAVVATEANLESHGGRVDSSVPALTRCLTEPMVYSCEFGSAAVDTCCTTTPGGLVLATQFWSTWTGLEKKGQKLPAESWTIHGLWPDNCDGSFEQYCDFSRQYDPDPSPAKLPNGTEIPAYRGPGADTFIKAFGRQDLLDYMSKYWINQRFPNTDLWAHEFSKHGTCMSTFDVDCYGRSYQKHEEVINYFDSAIRAFRQYPTFDMLAAFGITPSNKTSYPLSKIQNALKSQTGATPFLGCGNNGTMLNEVWYFSHVLGTAQYGTFKHIESTTPSTCSSTEGIWYYERAEGSETEVRD